MENWEKVSKGAKELNLVNQRGISCYGYHGNTNVRISDHLPKIHNIIDYVETLKINDAGQVDFIVYVISEDNEYQEELENEIKIAIQDYLEVVSNVKVLVHTEFDMDLFNYGIHTI